MRINSAWVVVKSVKVRETEDPDSKVTGTLDFGQICYKTSATVNGRVHVSSYSIKKANKGELKVSSGWIPVAALTKDEIKDYARLYFVNKMDRKVPVCGSFHNHKVTGHIKPGEKVAMLAKVGEWCLTSKGWSKWKWFDKCVGDFDYANVMALTNELLLCAAKDYTIAVNKIRKGFLTPECFKEAMSRIDEITYWFCDRKSDYSLFFEAGTGRDMLDSLNKQLRVDQKWLDEKHRILKEMHVRRHR